MIGILENRLCSECDIEHATHGDGEDFCGAWRGWAWDDSRFGALNNNSNNNKTKTVLPTTL